MHNEQGIQAEQVRLTGRANIICILKILEHYSDEDHILGMHEIIDHMRDDFGLKVDRRTVYSAIAALNTDKLGYDISCYDENGKGYYLRSRLFEPSEVRLLTDAVYSLHYITNKQTSDMVDKIQSTLSINYRSSYKHLFSVNTERKTENRTVFYNIDVLEEAISEGKKVMFAYMRYGLDKRLHPRREEEYVVNPYSMVCDNQNYYLICIKEGKSNISYYRIDLMKDIKITDDQIDVKPSEADLMSTKKIVYAYAGKQEDIVLRCDNSVIGGVIDKFGTDIRITACDENRFDVRLRAVPTGVLYWTMQYLSKVEIISPKSMREEAIKLIKTNKYEV
ncbi:MAG: WYL domain-containing protein [Christensenellaceae bacterium]|nr:WYL domain-containing protein [Christensenellaceae bacterium]